MNYNLKSVEKMWESEFILSLGMSFLLVRAGRRLHQCAVTPTASEIFFFKTSANGFSGENKQDRRLLPANFPRFDKVPFESMKAFFFFKKAPPIVSNISKFQLFLILLANNLHNYG